MRGVCRAIGYKSVPSGIGEITWSQDAEDLFLRLIFEGKRDGFFVDIGAHHPIQFSNTHALYMRGWRGINIDPLPGTKALFAAHRPEDITLEMGVAPERGERSYHMFSDPSMNTFSKEKADLNLKFGSKFIETRKIQTDTIVGILEKHAANRAIDLLSIDVEGMELPILETNDWRRYRPRVVLAEAMKTDADDLSNAIFKDDTKKYWIALDELENLPLHAYMKSVGYRPLCKGIVTTVYVDAKSE